MSEEALQIAEKRREAKGKQEKERYTHLNAEFQRIARRDKKAFLSDQCKETEENNIKERLLLLLSHFSRVRLFETPWTVAHQTPLSMGFSRQGHWSGLPFPSPMHESEK